MAGGGGGHLRYLITHWQNVTILQNYSTEQFGTERAILSPINEVRFSGIDHGSPSVYGALYSFVKEGLN